MADRERTQHGGRRPGAGRKPTLKPLSVIRLLDPQIRADLADLTARRREASGNPLLSQEQVVADLIRAAHAMITSNGPEVHESLPARIEKYDNQDEDTSAAPGAAAITRIRRQANELLAILRSKTSVGQRDGRRLLGLLAELLPLHAAHIPHRAILEELDRSHRDDDERNQAIATLLQQPLIEVRQSQWEQQLAQWSAKLAAGPIRRQDDHWVVIILAEEIINAAVLTSDRIDDLAARLLAKGISPTRWLALFPLAAATDL